MSEELYALIREDFVESKERERTTFTKGPFSMAGSKAKMLKYIIPLLPYRDKWIDVFGGSGIVSINRRPSPMLNVYNDVNSGAVNFFRVLRQREGKKRLIEYFNRTIHSREDFILCKNKWKSEEDDIERACKWLHMVRSSVLGKKVSFARQTNSKCIFPLRYDETIWVKLHLWARDYYFENLDFETCIRDFQGTNAVFYLDPPYLETDNSTFDADDKWTKDDLIRLLRCINECEGFFALSHYFSPLIDESVEWDEKHEWEVNLKSNLTGNKLNKYTANQKTKEYLWIKK